VLCVQEVFRGSPQTKILPSSFVDSMLQSKYFGLVTMHFLYTESHSMELVHHYVLFPAICFVN
jgi:hypothetical protein